MTKMCLPYRSPRHPIHTPIHTLLFIPEDNLLSTGQMGSSRGMDTDLLRIPRFSASLAARVPMLVMTIPTCGANSEN